MNTLIPPRGFPTSEHEDRLVRAQRIMRAQEIDALLLITEPEFRYFTGFLTQFWQSPTRPWFLLVPVKGKPIAVIPQIGAEVMAKTWVEDIRSWSSPQPWDEGVSLLVEAIHESGGVNARIGIPMGAETSLRMSLLDFDTLRAKFNFVDATSITRELRLTKSEAEIEKIRHICQLASDTFEALPDFVQVGDTEQEIFTKFKVDLLQRGADDVPYLVGGAGQSGYGDIISPPSEQAIQTGDVLMLDTGAVFDGYFCDFDRNYAFGQASDEAKQAYQVLYAATDAGMQAAKVGAKCKDVYNAMWKIIEEYSPSASGVGRLGHGLGMQLTEPPSHTHFDETVLKPGMVITLEPGLTIAEGKIMVHEENIVIREDGYELLSRRAPQELPII